MSYRYLVCTALSAAIAIVLLASVAVAGQSQNGATKPDRSTRPWNPPRMPDGRPDLQGVWDWSTRTPLQRPSDTGEKDFLDDSELEQLQEEAEKTLAERNDPLAPTQDACGAAREGDPGCHDAVWLETAKTFTNRTSLVVDPPDGRIPPLTAAAQKLRGAKAAKAAAQDRSGIYDTWEDLPPLTRCISRPLPRLTTPYNNGVQIVQAPGYVAIFYEFMHDVRIIPTDARPHLQQNIRQWNGDSRGRWEGDTLVVETTNFTDKQDFQGLPQGNLRMIERFTRVSADTIEYQVTIEDPMTWTRPWKLVLPWRSAPDYLIFEYACHEGNIQMATILRGSRAKEKELQAAPKANDNR